MLKVGVGAIRQWVATGVLSGPDVVLYATWIPVWGRWLVWLAGVFLPAHRPGFWYPEDIEYLAIPVLLGMLNRLVHLRLLTNRPVTWRWMLFLSAADIALSGRPRVNLLGPALREGQLRVVGSPAGEPLSAAAVATQTVRGLPLQHDLPVRVHLTVRVAGSGKDAC